MVARPPSLCSGCPHIDSFNAINDVLAILPKGRVFSDIGCYTLGALKPYEAINSCVIWGASITMAKGAADAGWSRPLPSLVTLPLPIPGWQDTGCHKRWIPITIFILDNGTTAMTRGQDSPAFGKIEDICKGMGWKKGIFHVLRPLKNLWREC